MARRGTRSAGGPDGILDRTGGVWIMSPSGKHIGTRIINTPGENTASLGFGDPDYRTLYITCRRKLLKIRVNTPGFHVF